MPKLERCPFCGCSMRIRKFIYPNGDEGLEPCGIHSSAVLWMLLYGIQTQMMDGPKKKSLKRGIVGGNKRRKEMFRKKNRSKKKSRAMLSAYSTIRR